MTIREWLTKLLDSPVEWLLNPPGAVVGANPAPLVSLFNVSPIKANSGENITLSVFLDRYAPVGGTTVFISGELSGERSILIGDGEVAGHLSLATPVVNKLTTLAFAAWVNGQMPLKTQLSVSPKKSKR